MALKQIHIDTLALKSLSRNVYRIIRHFLNHVHWEEAFENLIFLNVVFHKYFYASKQHLHIHTFNLNLWYNKLTEIILYELNKKSASWHASPSKLHSLNQLVVNSKRTKLYTKTSWASPSKLHLLNQLVVNSKRTKLYTKTSCEKAWTNEQ